MHMPDKKTLRRVLLALLAAIAIAVIGLSIVSRFVPTHTEYRSADGKYRCTVTRYPDGRVVERRQEISHGQDE